jgi:hypothetical protein
MWHSSALPICLIVSCVWPGCQVAWQTRSCAVQSNSYTRRNESRRHLSFSARPVDPATGSPPNSCSCDSRVRARLSTACRAWSSIACPPAGIAATSDAAASVSLMLSNSRSMLPRGTRGFAEVRGFRLAARDRNSTINPHQINRQRSLIDRTIDCFADVSQLFWVCGRDRWIGRKEGHRLNMGGHLKPRFRICPASPW